MMVVFPTTHLTLKAEKSFQKAQIGHRTVMKPRKIASDCGLAIRVASDDIQRCRETLLIDRLTPVRFFREKGDGWECVLQLGEDPN
jgi:hypothetical protein